jgi:hypothetical protein
MLLKASASKTAALPATAIALLAGAFSQSSSASDLAVVGPVESVDCKASSVQVLGVRFVARDAKTAAVLCSLGVSASPRYVSLQGTKDAANSVQLDSLQLVAKVSYVAGATPVYIRGLVSDKSVELGLVSISGAIVDASFSVPAPGSHVEVVGTQPVKGGIIFPTILNVATTNSSLGSGIASNSSLGSGVSSNSSLGSGLTTNSSLGSGIFSNSSMGSGIATNSSLGSGVATNSSLGSGIATNSSLGSGIATNSSLGSGLTTNSSLGSGIATNSSLGSGLTTNSSLGSGIATNSSLGSGFSTNSSLGSGAARNSSLGSGAALNSSLGSGRQIKSVIGSG